MGKYIDRNSKNEPLDDFDKYEALVKDGAEPIEEPTEWKEGLVVVVENPTFDAAAYAFDEIELNHFRRPDPRPKKWLFYPKAKELAK